MENKDDSGVALRRAVAGRLRRFFAEWTAQLAAGTAEIWARVERQLAHRPPKGESEADPHSLQRPPMQPPMQQQPVQQQQQQKKGEDER